MYVCVVTEVVTVGTLKGGVLHFISKKLGFDGTGNPEYNKPLQALKPL